MKRQEKWRDRHWNKSEERHRREGRKGWHRLQGQHDLIMRRIQMTPEQRMRELVYGCSLQRSFHDALFPYLTYRPEPMPHVWQHSE
jgi:hypothetical protein